MPGFARWWSVGGNGRNEGRFTSGWLVGLGVVVAELRSLGLQGRQFAPFIELHCRVRNHRGAQHLGLVTLAAKAANHCGSEVPTVLEWLAV